MLRHATAVMLVLALIPISAKGCEPILPLAKLLAGPNLVHASLIWLCTAVLVKCVAFAFLEQRLTFAKSMGFMFAGNSVSSLVGVLASVSAANGPMTFIAIGLVYILALKPARRLVAIAPWPSVARLRAPTIAAFFAGGIFASAILFGVARGLQDYDVAAYWALKYAVVLLALGIGFALTTMWEETVIAGLANRKSGTANFLPSVTRANYITFALVFAIAAIKMIPARLQSEGFLAAIHDLLSVAL